MYLTYGDNMTKKQNINTYVTSEVFDAVERLRGMVTRSAYVEYLLVGKLADMGEIETPADK